MAITNHERVGKALDLLKDGLLPFVERELKAQHGQYWITTVTANWRNELTWPGNGDEPHLDAALVLRLLWEQWNETFRRTLGEPQRSLVSELRDQRNKWAHRHREQPDAEVHEPGIREGVAGRTRGTAASAAPRAAWPSQSGRC